MLYSTSIRYLLKDEIRGTNQPPPSLMGMGWEAAVTKRVKYQCEENGMEWMWRGPGREGRVRYGSDRRPPLIPITVRQTNQTTKSCSSQHNEGICYMMV